MEEYPEESEYLGTKEVYGFGNEPKPMHVYQTSSGVLLAVRELASNPEFVRLRRNGGMFELSSRK